MNKTGIYERIVENLQFLKSKESLDVLDKTFHYVNQNHFSDTTSGEQSLLLKQSPINLKIKLSGKILLLFIFA